MITSDSVEKACSEVSAYSDDRMTTEFDRFFQSQPALCDFIVQLTSESSPEIQELSLFLSYMVFKAVELETSGAIGPVDSEAIEEAYQESEHWIDQMSRVNADAVEGLLRDLHSESEPHLLRYVTSELNQPTASGATLADEEKGEVFFVLKTVISSLMARDKRRRIATEAEK
jgi:hypothetical protein